MRDGHQELVARVRAQLGVGAQLAQPGDECVAPLHSAPVDHERVVRRPPRRLQQVELPELVHQDARQEHAEGLGAVGRRTGGLAHVRLDAGIERVQPRDLGHIPGARYARAPQDDRVDVPRSAAATCASVAPSLRPTIDTACAPERVRSSSIASPTSSSHDRTSPPVAVMTCSSPPESPVAVEIEPQARKAHRCEPLGQVPEGGDPSAGGRCRWGRRAARPCRAGGPARAGDRTPAACAPAHATLQSRRAACARLRNRISSGVTTG